MTPDNIVWWAGAIIALAGAIKGAEYLIRKSRAAGSRGIKWFDEKRRVRKLMAQLTDDEGWPNGSHSIIQSHNALYDKMAMMNITLNQLSKDVNDYLLTEGKRLDGDL